MFSLVFFLLVHVFAVVAILTVLFSSKEDKKGLKDDAMIYVQYFKVVYRYYRIQKAISSKPVLATV